MVWLHLLGLITAVSATALLDRNLEYRSPFEAHPQVYTLHDVTLHTIADLSEQFSQNTRSIHARHVQHARRQVVDASGLVDEHYPTFYGADFSNVHLRLPLHASQILTLCRAPSYGAAV